ncbi:MAG: peptide ABC transporter substrate-binding protein [Pseudomonadota bacterium]
MSTNAHGELEVGAADSYEISDDGKTLTFVLRDDLFWSNGSPMKSQDFVAGIRFAARAENRSPQAKLLSAIRGFDEYYAGGDPKRFGVTAINEKELRIELDEATPYFLWILDYPVSYPRSSSSKETQLTNGPYKLIQRTPGSSVELQKNASYWDSRNVAIERVKYLSIVDENAMLQRFRAGEIHVTSTVPNQYTQWIEDNLEHAYKPAQQLATYFYFFNTEDPKLKTATVREALYHAVDRKKLTQEVLRGGQQPAYTLVPPETPNYSDSVAQSVRTKARDFDFAKARNAMQKLGYNEQNPLEITILVNSGTNHRSVALFVSSEWSSKLPVRTVIQTEEFRVLLDTMKDPAKWEVIRSSWTADYPDAISFLEIFAEGNPNNFLGYANVKFQEGIEALPKLENKARQLKLADLETTLLADFPILPLYFFVKRRLVTDQVEGFHTNPLAILRSKHLSFRSETDPHHH